MVDVVVKIVVVLEEIVKRVDFGVGMFVELKIGLVFVLVVD